MRLLCHGFNEQAFDDSNMEMYEEARAEVVSLVADESSRTPGHSFVWSSMQQTKTICHNSAILFIAIANDI